MKNSMKASLSTHAWKPRLFRIVTVALGGFVAINGMTPETTWSQIPALLTPAAVVGLLIMIIGAASTGGESG